MRRQLPLFLVFICGVFMVFQYFVPHETSEWVYEYLLDWTVIIGIFALALGIWSLVHVSVNKIRRKKQYWPYSYVTLLGLFAMMIFGWTGMGENGYYTPSKIFIIDKNDSTLAIELGSHISSDSTKTLLKDTLLTIKLVGDGHPITSGAVRERFGDSLLNPLNHFKFSNAYLNTSDSLYYAFVRDSSFGFYFYTKEGLSNPLFTNFFNYIMIPIQSTMFSLLAFFIASAAYRAFRARNVLSTLLLLAAIIVMLRFTPGPWDDYLARTSSWIMNVPNMAAQRAITIGIGLGMVGTALKVVLGIERGYMGKG